MKSNFSLEEINKDIAVEFVKQYHYSKIFPRIVKYYLGVFKDDELGGVILLGWGTQPLQTIKKIFNHTKIVTNDYLEISKMCFLPKFNNDKNFGSQSISLLIKWMKLNTKCLFLYTLADGLSGKCGYVYQASNFKYIGKFSTSIYLMPNGEKLHPRSTKLLLEENAKMKNKEKLFWLTNDYMELKSITKIQGFMFRYIYPLNKEAKKILNTYDNYKNISNPKDDQLKFYKMLGDRKKIAIDAPTFDRDKCEYNYQKF